MSVAHPQSRFDSFVLTVLMAILLALSGCKQRERSPASENPAGPASRIRVIPGTNELRIQTSTAEFVLSANGYLKASLILAGAPLTLNDPAKEPGQVLTVARQPVRDFAFDTANVRVSDAQGKLGKSGKHIDVPASSPTLALDETLALEFYDDFPGLALVSASFRNAGHKDVALDAVALARHRFRSAQTNPSASKSSMWTFEGSSLKWGKDEIFPVPAKFSQENPFGAPVESKDD